MNNRPRAPLLVTVNVTGACNLSCDYCYFQPRTHAHMTMDDYQMVLGTLRENEIFLLTLSGGEAFLHPRISEMLTLAYDSFDHVSILSNGTAINEGHLKTIRSIVESKGLFPIQVSLDSLDPQVNDDTRGHTSLVLANLNKLKQSGANITIAIVVSARNIHQLSDTIASLSAFTQHFHVMPIKPVPFLQGRDADLQVSPERMQEAWHELAALRNKFGIRIRIPMDDLCNRTETSATGAPCMAGFTKLAIDPNLDVRPCDKCITTVVGNLKDDSFQRIWNGSRLAEVYQRDVPYCIGRFQAVNCPQNDAPS